MSDRSIPGYTFGDESVPEPPIGMDELDRLKQSVMFTEEDEEHLREAGTCSSPRLTRFSTSGTDSSATTNFSDATTGESDEEYLDRVRSRFGQWIRDTCDPPYEAWLAYQFEIARRHHRSGKNQTDEVDSVPNIDPRYVLAFIYPITATVRDFLANGDHSDAMYHA